MCHDVQHALFLPFTFREQFFSLLTKSGIGIFENETQRRPLPKLSTTFYPHGERKGGHGGKLYPKRSEAEAHLVKIGPPCGRAPPLMGGSCCNGRGCHHTPAAAEGLAQGICHRNKEYKTTSGGASKDARASLCQIVNSRQAGYSQHRDPIYSNLAISRSWDTIVRHDFPHFLCRRTRWPFARGGGKLFDGSTSWRVDHFFLTWKMLLRRGLQVHRSPGYTLLINSLCI